MTRRSQRKAPPAPDPRPHLDHDARAMLLARRTKQSVAQRNRQDVPNWERHAINAVLDLEEAEKELKTACAALEVARSYVDGQALDRRRFSPRETLEIIDAALCNLSRNPSMKLIRPGPFAVPQERK